MKRLTSIFVSSVFFILFFTTGCSKKEKTEISNTTDLQLSIYPNPVSTEVRISIRYNRSHPGLLKVFDSKAEIAGEFNIEPNAGVKNFALNLADKPTGLYQVILESGNEFIKKSFLKTN
jgi:hypothetical protein